MTPIYLEGYKLIAKIDTGSEITCLNKSIFTDILKFNKILSVKGSLSFASANNSVKRIGKTEPLVMSYIADISCTCKKRTASSQPTVNLEST